MSQDTRPDYAQLMKGALVELKQLRARLGELTRAQTEPIAIVGMSCRLPGGACSPDTYWQLLHDGVDAIRQVPADRWDASAYYDPNPDTPGKIATRHGGFLDGIDQFDPAFFGMSPREAHSLDPQQRLLLEVTWEALEQAGQSPAQLYGSPTGVFVGMSTFDYALHQVGGVVEDEDLGRIDGYVATGSTMSPAAGRLSYVLGLNGPSMVVDTACSSSLVATHLAVTSLRGRECDLAIVGGVNIVLRPEWNVNFTRAHMLAPDGRCKTFDASADGYTRGEGCAVLVLQRLSDAVAMRRRIVAVIRGSAVNQDGASGGLTVPNGPAQEQVIRRALDAAGLRPEQIGYVEAHGTGTSLGDPIEVAALGAVFGEGRPAERPLRIGSVKTNIGHLEAAAGVAGLMKVALSLRHGEIPPHLHFRTPNPLIDWDRLPIEVPVAPTPWPSAGEPRRAGISSFGFTGTNAHVVLEEAPSESRSLNAEPRAPDGTRNRNPEPSTRSEDQHRTFHIVPISARTEPALGELAARYERHWAMHPELALADVAFTAATGRSHFRHRLAVVAASTADAQAMLAAYTAGAAAAGVITGQGTETPKIAFLFTGQGSQYVGMGRPLYDREPVFRDAIDRCDAILRPLLDRPLLDVLYPPAGHASPLDDTAYTQPALFALEYGLAMLWRSWGIVPDAVMGHSVGEYVAACVAGVFGLEDGLALIAARARLMQSLPRTGQMVAVQAGADRAAAAIAAHAPGTVSIAAINGPNTVVVSGDAGGVAAVVAALAADGIPTQPLRVSHAFHSPLMEPMLAEFERIARGVRYAAPGIAIVSNVSGRLARTEMASPEYWVRHVRQPVRFADGVAALQERGCRVFVELGPGSTLLGLGRASVPVEAGAALAWLPSLRAGHEWEQLLRSLAELYVRGAAPDWAALTHASERRPVTLPTYPFQRQRYWVDIDRRVRVGEARVPSTPLRPADPDAPDDVKAGTTGGHAGESRLYEIAWREWTGHQPPATSYDPPGHQPLGHWVILQDQGPVGMLLAGLLRERGARCTLVSRGDAFAKVDEEHFRVDASHPDDIARLWASVTADGPVRGVVHLWSLDTPARHLMVRSLEGDTALESALHMIRAVVSARGTALAALWCVTRGAVAAGGSAVEPLAIAQAPLWGLGRVAALEHPDVWGGLVDLDPAAADAHADARTLAHVLRASGGEDQVAVRGDGLLVPRLVPRARPAYGHVLLDPEGSYIVAGGLGALGLHAARWLVSKGARVLVLASRRGLDTPGAHEAVRSLEALGARTVSVVAADLSREADVARLVAEAARHAPLRGVVHAAGVDAPVPLSQMSVAQLRSVLASKVLGGWHLHDLTRDRMLDLFVLFSSVSSVWGAPGRAHYAAANAFLDALAHERRRMGLHALGVDWGPWQGGGMAGDGDLRQLERSGIRALEPAAALEALETLIVARDVQAIVADVEWSRFRATFEARRPRPLLEELVAASGDRGPDTARAASDGESDMVSAPRHRRPDKVSATAPWIARLRPLGPHERPAVLEALLRAEVASTLGYRNPEELPVDQSVFELGMDSLRAVDLAIRLQRQLGLDRSIQFFDCPQIGALATRLLSDLALDAPAPVASTADASSDPSDRSGVTTYTEAYARDIVEFSRVAWPARAEALIAPRWRWMFVESAARLGREPRVWLYRDEGRIVAHHGAIPVRLEVGGEPVDSAWFADTMVLEEHRASATGARLMVASNEAFPVGLSLGQTAQMRQIALRLGWHQVAPLQTLVLVLRPDRVLKEKVHPLVAGMAGIGLHLRQDFRRLLAGPKDERLSVRTIDRFDERHDRLWASVRHEYGCAVTRDASYLNWKYIAQPGQQFVRLEFERHGRPVAMAVLLLTDADGGAYGYRRAFIVDLVVSPSDSRLVLGVLEAARQRCVAAGADTIVCHLINEQLEKTLQAYGFARRDPTRYLLAYPHDVSADLCRQVLSPRGWLITMGDSDIDRPFKRSVPARPLPSDVVVESGARIVS